MAETIRVAVTGAAGQVAYAMLGRLASRRGVRAEQENHPATAGDHAGAAGPRRRGHGAGGLLVPDAARHRLHRRSEQGVQGLQLGAAGRLVPAQAGHGTQGTARHQRQDLRRPGQGAGGQRRQGRAHPRRRQSVQHQLPGRLQQRQGDPRRALDGHDAPRSQPRPHRPGEEGRRRQRGRDADDHLGQSQQHAVSRLHQRQDQGPPGHRGHHGSRDGWKTRSCR